MKHLKERVEYLFENSALGLGSVLFDKAVMLGFNVALARYLGVSSYGVFALVLVILSFGKLLNVSGFNQGVKKYIPIYGDDYKKISEIISSSMGYVIIVGIIIIILTFAFGNYLNIVFSEARLTSVLKIIVFLIPLYGIIQIIDSYLVSIKKAKYSYLLINIFMPLVLLVLMVSVLYFNNSLVAASIAYLVSFFIVFLAGLVIFKYKKSFSFSFTRIFPKLPFLKFSLTLGLMTVVSLLLLRIDTLMVGFFLTSEAVGIYKAAFSFAILVSFLLPVVNHIFSPIISSLSSKSDLKSLEELYKTTTRWTTTMAVFGFLVMLFLGKSLLGLFGKSFIEGYPILILLGLSQLINAGVGSTGFMLSMSGHQKKELKNLLLLLGLNIVLNIVFIKIFGLIGAAIATAVSISAINCLKLSQIYRLFKIHPFSFKNIKKIIAAVILTCLVFGAEILIINYAYYSFFFHLIALFLAGVVFFYVGITQSDRKLVINIIKKSIFPLKALFLKKQ